MTEQTETVENSENLVAQTTGKKVECVISGQDVDSNLTLSLTREDGEELFVSIESCKQLASHPTVLNQMVSDPKTWDLIEKSRIAFVSSSTGRQKGQEEGLKFAVEQMAAISAAMPNATYAEIQAAFVAKLNGEELSATEADDNADDDGNVH